MSSPRWSKLGRDLWTERGRALLMTTAIAVSLLAIGTVLGGYSILTREMAVNYLGTRPASAALELEGGVTRALVEKTKSHPEVSEAEARRVLVSRMKVGDDWRPLLLFVIDDFADLRLNTFRAVSGAWPPPVGTMLVEQSAVAMIEAQAGQQVFVKTPNGAPKNIPITGLVHDPGLAPAWQERAGYGYITQETLVQLGEPALLDELRIEVRGQPLDIRTVEESAKRVAGWLGGQGFQVHEIRVPPPAKHPHQRQMESVLLLLLCFSAMALLLSAILVATSLSAMLARQVREIGVMKSLGARSSQLAAMYAALVAGLGLVSVLVAAPLSIFAARAMAGVISSMLNLTLTSLSIPWWVTVIQLLAGVLLPLLVALVPILGASRVTVSEAMNQHGVSAGMLNPWLSSLPAPLRNVLRRPTRLALTLGLLAAGGAMFMTALNVSRSWEKNLDKIHETRYYDVEIRFNTEQPPEVVAKLRALEGVTQVEEWGFREAALAKPGEIDIARTYPDRGHGSFSIMAPPANTNLIKFPLLAGRWLEPGDTDAVVLNHLVRGQAPNVKVGDEILLSIDGHPTKWRVVGLVEEVGSPGAAYVTDRAFGQAAHTGARSRMLRIVTHAASSEERGQIIREIDSVLQRDNVSVAAVIPFSEFRTAVGDHIVVLIRLLLAMAGVMALVGALGLTSTMSTSVIERTKEFGILKVLGASPARVLRMLISEALFIGALSWGLALLVSIPLTALVDWLVGMLGFLAPLPLIIAVTPALLWLFLVGVVALLATLFPARRASGLTVRDAMVYL